MAVRKATPSTIHTPSMTYEGRFRHPGSPGISSSATKPAEHAVPTMAEHSRSGRRSFRRQIVRQHDAVA